MATILTNKLSSMTQAGTIKETTQPAIKSLTGNIKIADSKDEGAGSSLKDINSKTSVSISETAQRMQAMEKLAIGTRTVDPPKDNETLDTKLTQMLNAANASAQGQLKLYASTQQMMPSAGGG